MSLRLTLTKSRLTVAATATATVQCNQTLGNQGSSTINGAVVVNGNLTLAFNGNALLNGNGTLLICRVRNGHQRRVKRCHSGQPDRVCPKRRLGVCAMGTCNNNKPINNDANCQLIDLPVLPVELTWFRAGTNGACAGRPLGVANRLRARRQGISDRALGQRWRNVGVIGEVMAAGTSTTTHAYTWQDERPLTGQSYYRLRQADADGSITRSAIVSVLTALPAKDLALWPATAAGYYEVQRTRHLRHAQRTDVRWPVGTHPDADQWHRPARSDWLPGWFLPGAGCLGAGRHHHRIPHAGQ